MEKVSCHVCGDVATPDGQWCMPCEDALSQLIKEAEAWGSAIEIPEEAPTSNHGRTSYARYECRCATCKAANADYKRKQLAARKGKPVPENVEHGANCYSNWGCRCDVCIAAWTRACAPRVRRYQENHPEKAVEKAAAQMRANNESRDSASRHGQPWTGPDLELAARADLTIAQIAEMTGRTLAAVQKARQRLREDPKFINLAGLPRETEAAR